MSSPSRQFSGIGIQGILSTHLDSNSDELVLAFWLLSWLPFSLILVIQFILSNELKGSPVDNLRQRLHLLLPRYWSNSAEAWQERAGLVLVALGIFFGYTLFDKIGLAALSFLAALWLAVIVVFLRRGWLSLLGPLFLFDIFRTTRRSRYFLLRIYVYFILLLLFCVVLTWTSRNRIDLPARRGAVIAENVFYFFLLSHLALSALFTPGYVASALTEEKERNTLEALMATDLSSREIVLSKLLVRLANLGLMLLTGLPILAMLQVMGGVDPDFMMVGYVAILFFTITLACLAISNSVRCRRSRDAIMATYMELAAYLVLTSGLFLLTRTSAAPGTLNLGFVRLDPVHLLQIASAGNPILGLERVVEHTATGGNLSQVLGQVMADFLLFHVTVSLVLAGDAVRRFREAFRKQTYGQMVKDRNHRLRLRPSMGNWPLLWKEVFTETASKPSRFRRMLMLAFIAASFFPILVFEANPRLSARAPSRLNQIAEFYHGYANIAGCIILCALLIRVVVQAALVFSRERDQQTMDSLLTCPVSSPSIIGAKWLGCMLSVRKLWLWLAVVWTIGVSMGGASIVSYAVLLAFWVVYAGVSTLFGQWCSLVCKTSLRAILFTIVALGITTSGILVLPFQAYGFEMTSESHPSFQDWLMRGQVGMAPPIVFARIIPWRFASSNDPTAVPALAAWEWPMAVLGAGLWICAGGVFYALLWSRLRQKAKRKAVPPTADQPEILLGETKPLLAYPAG